MMKKTALFISLLLAGVGFAQIGSGFDPVAGNDRSWTDMQIGTVFKEVPILGSPYMNEIYKMGIANVNGKEIQLLMRYDAFRDQIELIDKNQKSFNLLRKENIEATFEGRTYKVMEFTENGETTLGYVNPLTEGEVVLYFKPKKLFVQAEKPDHGYDIYDPPYYKDAHEYYLQRKDGNLVKVRLTKGSLLKHLKDKAPQLKDFITERNMKVKTEIEAIAVINYYNQLVSGL